MRYLFAANIILIMVALTGCSPGQQADISTAMKQYKITVSNHLLLAAVPEGASSQQPRNTRTDVMGENWIYLAVNDASGNSNNEEKGEPVKPAYIPWQQRKGPAYPGDMLHSIGRDAKEMPATLWDDTRATFTNRYSLMVLALAVASGAAIAGSDADDRAEDHYTKHGSQLNKFWDNVGDVGGQPGLHFGLAGGAYLLSLATDDVELYRKSKTLLNALSITGLMTVGLKATFRTQSPNGDPDGWPSGHSSSSFCLATVLYHQYGPWVGVPLMGFAGFVAYERVDARNHDFSDVVSGSLIGIAIGHAVASNQEMKILGMDVVPYTDPANGAIGLALIKRW